MTKISELLRQRLGTSSVSTPEDKIEYESIQSIMPEGTDMHRIYREIEDSKKTYTEDEQRQVILKYLKATVGVGTKCTEEDFVSNIKSDKEYQNMLRVMRNWYFGNGENRGGIYIWSVPGAGKTVALRAFSYMSIMLWRNVKCRGLIHYYSVQREIKNKIKETFNNLSFDDEMHIAIDDLDIKYNEVNHYGYNYHINDLIKNRYMLWQNKGYHTIISSNIYPHPIYHKGENGEEIKIAGTLDEILDSASYDRFKQQYEIIALNSESKR